MVSMWGEARLPYKRWASPWPIAAPSRRADATAAIRNSGKNCAWETLEPRMPLGKASTRIGTDGNPGGPVQQPRARSTPRRPPLGCAGHSNDDAFRETFRHAGANRVASQNSSQFGPAPVRPGLLFAFRARATYPKNAPAAPLDTEGK